MYVTIDDTINQVVKLGPGTLLVKADIKGAFRLLPVHPADCQLLQITWKGFVLFVTDMFPFTTLAYVPSFAMEDIAYVINDNATYSCTKFIKCHNITCK